MERRRRENVKPIWVRIDFKTSTGVHIYLRTTVSDHTRTLAKRQGVVAVNRGEVHPRGERSEMGIAGRQGRKILRRKIVVAVEKEKGGVLWELWMFNCELL